MVFGKQMFDLGFGWWRVRTPQRSLDQHSIVISYAIAFIAS
jgi:hypothetical protein